MSAGYEGHFHDPRRANVIGHVADVVLWTRYVGVAVTSAARRVFVHVGCPKSGTTFLQSSLWQSRDELRLHDVELPVDRVSQFYLALAVRQKLNPDLDPPEAFTAKDRFAQALVDSTSPTILLSNENLANATPEQATGLHHLITASLAAAEIHLVITARDLARQLPAAWQQQIQQRRTTTWDGYLRSLREGDWVCDAFPRRTRRRHRGAVGGGSAAARVHIVTVPPPTAPRQLLLERYCGVIGIDLAILSDAPPVPNESLGWVQAELLRRVDIALRVRLPHSRAGFGRVGKRYFAHEALVPMGGKRPGLPPEMSAWCHEHTERIIACLEKEGYDVAGDLDDLRSAPASTDSSAVSDSEIAVAAVEAIADLLDQRHRDLEQIDALQSRPRRRRPIRRLRRRLGRRLRRRLGRQPRPT